MNLKLLVSPQNQGRILLSCSKKQFVKEADIDAYMYIASNNTSVYMEFNWWVGQRFVGLRNSSVLKSIWDKLSGKAL